MKKTVRRIDIRIFVVKKGRPIYGVFILEGDILILKEWVKLRKLATLNAARHALAAVGSKGRYDIAVIHDEIDNTTQVWERSKS